MRFAVVLMAVAVLTLVACGVSEAPATSTPRPTYTPYPTPTPAPTATPRPTYTPYATTARATVTPTNAPDYVLVGDMDYFGPDAYRLVEEGTEHFESGRYEAAIESFKEAIRAHTRPSAVLENRIGLAYSYMEEPDLAIQHFSNAIEIEDTSTDRVNRGLAYLMVGQCDAAVTDAKAALAMAPESVVGFHTDAEANTLLANCYELEGDLLAALQHLEAAIAIAEENSYLEIDLEILRVWLDDLKQSFE